MKGDVALAGFVITAEEWQAFDPVSRAQLVATITRREDPWLVPPGSSISEPHPIPVAAADEIK